jgi:hypothetical protein
MNAVMVTSAAIARSNILFLPTKMLAASHPKICHEDNRFALEPKRTIFTKCTDLRRHLWLPGAFWPPPINPFQPNQRLRWTIGVTWLCATTAC